MKYYYQHGYSIIHPLTPKDNQDWNYTVQAHKNHNGIHYDLRLHRPGEHKVYSWALKKLPMSKTDKASIKAFRTKDHDFDSLFFEGPIRNKKGSGHVKILQTGKARMNSIGRRSGLTFQIEGSSYRLKPVKGKNYNLEMLD